MVIRCTIATMSSVPLTIHVCEFDFQHSCLIKLISGGVKVGVDKVNQWGVKVGVDKVNQWGVKVEVIKVMVFNTTFNNLSVTSWQSVLLVEETRVSRENHRPATSH